MSGSDFAIEETSTGGSDLRWLRSSHGVKMPGTASLTSLASVINSDGKIPSGVGVGVITASGLYGLFDSTASDGREVLAGFTYTDVSAWNSKGAVLASGKAPISVLVHGHIKRSVLPVVAQRTSISHTTVSTGQFSYFD